MIKPPSDVAKEIKRIERRSRQLTRSIGALRQAIDVLREHEAFAAEQAPPARRAVRERSGGDDFARALGDEANDDARTEHRPRAVASSEKTYPV